VALLALERRADETPSDYLISLLMNRNYPVWRILFPTPSDIRRRLELASTDRVGPAAYAAFLMKRLRVTPLHLRQLWGFWHAALPSPQPEASSSRSETPLSEE
jgi:hypothetical protein